MADLCNKATLHRRSALRLETEFEAGACFSPVLPESI